MSVQFSPDGTKVVSGGYSGTIKVWDAVNFKPFEESEWEEVDISAMEKDDDGEVEIDGLGYISKNYWKNVITGEVRKEKPFAGALVVGRPKSGIQVRNRQKRPLPVKSDLLRPPTQPR